MLTTTVPPGPANVWARSISAACPRCRAPMVGTRTIGDPAARGRRLTAEMEPMTFKAWDTNGCQLDRFDVIYSDEPGGLKMESACPHDLSTCARMAFGCWMVCPLRPH